MWYQFLSGDLVFIDIFLLILNPISSFFYVL